MPIEPDADDLFQDRRTQSDGEFLAQSRMQVSMAVGTGVLTIMLTTAIVVLMGQPRQSLADGPRRTIGAESVYTYTPPAVAPTAPAVVPSPATVAPTTVPTTQPVSTTPAATPTKPATNPPPPPPTTTPPTTPPPPPPPVVTVSGFGCQNLALRGGEETVCTITLDPAPTTMVVVDIRPYTSDLLMQGSANFAVGQVSMDFTVTAALLAEVPENETRSTTVEVSVNGSVMTVSIAVYGVGPLVVPAPAASTAAQ